MNLSYWEIKSWLQNIDFTVIGSGIVGLNCAIQLKERFPVAKVLVLEKGILPQGASTKNAGFACFGSLSELIADLNSHSEAQLVNLVKRRVEGLQLLRKNLGDSSIDYKKNGGYELFLKSQLELFEKCQYNTSKINKLLKPIFNSDVFSWKKNNQGFKNIIPQLSYNSFEGQIDTGKMMEALLKLAYRKEIKILNNLTVEAIEENLDDVTIKTEQLQLKTNKVFIATNGFAAKLLQLNIEPARAQVLITKPIDALKIKGTYHLDEGYYYFRNIDNRILFGGGRNLDFKAEQTTEFGVTNLIQNRLDSYLKDIILPDISFEIDHRWSGIMGVGKEKLPIVKQYSNNIFCGVRLGGMGVAIGSLVGKELADLLP
jgi:glycine/D-amino acid oxidase-like deaminating enzyme